MISYVLLREDISKVPNPKSGEQYKPKWAESEAVDRKNGNCLQCPLCGAPITMKQWMPPRKIKLTKPKYPDYVSYWAGDGIVVSERFKKAYEISGLKGITVFNPLEVVKVSYMKENSPISPQYYDAIPAVSFAKVDNRKSKIKGYKNEPKCSLCNPRGKTVSTIKGITLDWSGWEGEDIFRLHELGGTYFTTQCFVDFCQHNEFTNFSFVLSSNYIFGVKE